MSHPADEVATAVDAYVAVRERIEAGEATWIDLAPFFTDDAVYIDPAWGRIQGIDEIRRFLVDSMVGFEDWRFPIDFVAISGDDVAVKWRQVLPTGHQQSGWSHLVYAGEGRFGFDEDVLNMAHVIEDMKASGWRPPAGFTPPPASPDRDITRP